MKSLGNYILIILFVCINMTSCYNKDQIAKIDHKFIGCFGGGHNKLILFRQNGEVLAKLEMDGKRLKHVILNSSQIEAFNLFIRELKSLKETEWCTTVEYYTVYLNDETIRKTDGSCEWTGFSRLLNSLFKLKV